MRNNRDYFTKPLQGNGRDNYDYGKSGQFESERRSQIIEGLAWGAALALPFWLIFWLVWVALP